MMTDNKLNKIRVRIAPSPTGPLHIGTARAALFNYLFAKQKNGDFILRVEDTDTKRSELKWEKNIMESLKWLGLEWDEFYRQSERIDVYKKYIKKLLDQGMAYYCFCSEEELQAQKEYQISIGKPTYYSCKCRKFTEQEVNKNLQNKKDFVIRFRVPLDQKIIFQDLVRKKISFDSNLIGDFIISKKEWNPLYNFAAVIDDYEMKISHIIRGEDHISNTPKQILLQNALGFPRIKYAHIPLILEQDRSKLSKRRGATAVSEYKEKGYLPETLINFMAFLGWNPGKEREIYSAKSLIKEFSLEKIQKSGAVFNIKRLNYLNGFYIREKSLDKLTEMCIPYLIETGLIKPVLEEKERVPNLIGYFGKEIVQKYIKQKTNEKIGFDYLKKIVKIYQERLKILSEISELTDFFLQEKKLRQVLLKLLKF